MNEQMKRRMSVQEVKGILRLLDKSDLTNEEIAEMLSRPVKTVSNVRSEWSRVRKNGTVSMKTGDNMIRAFEEYRGLDKGPINRMAPKKSCTVPVSCAVNPDNQITFDEYMDEPKTLTGNEDNMEKILGLLSGIMSGINQIIQMMPQEEELPL